MKTLEIIIPTYQRVGFLLKSLEFLRSEIGGICETKRPSLLVIDNGSTDNTQEALKAFAKANPGLNLKLILKPENEGMEANFATGFKEASGDFILFASDDDLLAVGYLSYLAELIQLDDAPGVVIPGIVGVRQDGTMDNSPRQFSFATKNFPPGFKSSRYLSHFCTQMSGLVFRNDRAMVDKYLASRWRNVYPFVFFGTAQAFKRGGLLAPTFRTRVLHGNMKAWDYPTDGYTDAVLRNFRILGVSHARRVLYEIEFLRYQKFRFEGIGRLPLVRRVQVIMGLKAPSPVTKLYILVSVFR